MFRKFSLIVLMGLVLGFGGEAMAQGDGETEVAVGEGSEVEVVEGVGSEEVVTEGMTEGEVVVDEGEAGSDEEERERAGALPLATEEEVGGEEVGGEEESVMAEPVEAGGAVEVLAGEEEGMFSIRRLMKWGSFGAAVILIILILMQERGTGLSATFGGTGSFYASKRGVEKLVFRLTVAMGVLFVILAVMAMVV